MKKHISRNCSRRFRLRASPYTEWGGVSILLGKCVFGTYCVLGSVLATVLIKSLLPLSVVGAIISPFYRRGTV